MLTQLTIHRLRYATKRSAETPSNRAREALATATASAAHHEPVCINLVGPMRQVSSGIMETNQRRIAIDLLRYPSSSKSDASHHGSAYFNTRSANGGTIAIARPRIALAGKTRPAG